MLNNNFNFYFIRKKTLKNIFYEYLKIYTKFMSFKRKNSYKLDLFSSWLNFSCFNNSALILRVLSNKVSFGFRE